MFRLSFKLVKPASSALLILAPQITELRSHILRSIKTTVPKIQRQQNSGLFRRLTRKIGFLDVSKSRLKGAGFVIYERCTDAVNFVQFIEEIDIPDTLFSWFLITELHCWLLMSRAMAEGAEGRVVRNGIAEALWQDVSTRIKKLEVPSVGATVKDLSYQFQAAIIGYDEGLQSSDIVLAGALWRRLLSRNEAVKPETVELLVSYVRRQVVYLDSVPRDKILFKPEFILLPFKEK